MFCNLLFVQTHNISKRAGDAGQAGSHPCQVLFPKRDVDEMLAELTSNGTDRERRSTDLHSGNKWRTNKPIKFAIDETEFSE